MPKKFLIIIPVRLASTRLPNKPLADILGKSMIQRVYEKAVKANIGEVLIACDGKEIADEVEKFGGKYVITDPDLPSGTDRIYAAFKEASKDENYDAILNLQGDLPNIDPNAIKAAANVLTDDFDIATIASKIKNKNEIQNPNVVKIAIAFADKENTQGNALYFSRCPIPYSKNLGSAPIWKHHYFKFGVLHFLVNFGLFLQKFLQNMTIFIRNFYKKRSKFPQKLKQTKSGQNLDQDYFHHIGIYAYSKKSLEKFVALPQSNLEKQESLEQLRALENNMKIAVKIVDTHPLSVDTQEDLEEVKRQIKN